MFHKKANIFSVLFAFLLMFTCTVFNFPAAAQSANNEETEIVQEAEEGYGFYETETNSNEGLRVKVSSKDGFKYVRVYSKPDDEGNYARTGDFLAIELVNVDGSQSCPLEIYVGDSNDTVLVAGNAGQKQYGVSANGVLLKKNVSANCVWVGPNTGHSTLLIDYSRLCDSWASPVSQKTLTDIKFVSIGFSTSYNLGQEVLIKRVYTVDKGETLFDYNAPAFVNSEGFVVSAGEVLEKGKLDELIDFTTIEKGVNVEDVENVDLIPSNWKNALSVSLNGASKQLMIKDTLVGAVEFSMKHADEGGNVTSAGHDDENYSRDLFAYVDLWNSPDPNGTEIHTGIAAKVMSTYLGTPFKLVFTDAADNEIYYTGLVKNKPVASTYPFVSDDGVDMGIPAYWNCLWSLKTPGTLYFPYSDMFGDHFCNNNTGAVNGNGKLDRIKKIQLAMDTATIYAIKYSIVIGTMCDVDMNNEEVYKLFNTAEYGANEIDMENPNNSAVVKPASEDFKNSNWIYKRATEDMVVGRSTMQTKYTGDVKVLEDFHMPDSVPKDKSKVLASNLILAEEQTSHLDIIQNERTALGTSLSWTIGDYTTERLPINSEYCALTVAADGSTLAENWANMTDAKGISLYVKNTSDTLASFNVEFGQTQENGKYERWSISKLDSRVYAYDLNTGKEMTLVASYGVYLPPQFEGYIRLPFAVFSNPEWNHEGDGVFSPTADLLGIYLTTHMASNSGVTFIIDELGFYYQEFTVSSIFQKSFTIKDAMASDYFGG